MQLTLTKILTKNSGWTLCLHTHKSLHKFDMQVFDFMRDMMLRKRRDLELFRAYQKALQENEFSDQREAVDYVRKHEAPRWFVSKEFCAAVISSWLRGKESYKMRNNKKRKFRALYELYIKLRQEFPYSAMNHLDMCAALVEMPAPEWFIDHQLASRIIAEQINIRNEQIASKYGRQ